MSIDELAKLPALAPTPFPFRGHKDFRGFTQDDYDNWAAGIFERVIAPDGFVMPNAAPERYKWIGGSARLLAAMNQLSAEGYTLRVVGPHVEEVGNESDGYDKIKRCWNTIYFDKTPED